MRRLVPALFLAVWLQGARPRPLALGGPPLAHPPRTRPQHGAADAPAHGPARASAPRRSRCRRMRLTTRGSVTNPMMRASPPQRSRSRCAFFPASLSWARSSAVKGIGQHAVERRGLGAARAARPWNGHRVPAGISGAKLPVPWLWPPAPTGKPVPFRAPSGAHGSRGAVTRTA